MELEKYDQVHILLKLSLKQGLVSFTEVDLWLGAI